MDFEELKEGIEKASIEPCVVQEVEDGIQVSIPFVHPSNEDLMEELTTVEIERLDLEESKKRIISYMNEEGYSTEGFQMDKGRGTNEYHFAYFTEAIA